MEDRAVETLAAFFRACCFYTNRQKEQNIFKKKSQETTFFTKREVGVWLRVVVGKEDSTGESTQTKQNKNKKVQRK